MSLRLLIIGCGDVGLRVLRLLNGRCRVYALTSSPDRCAELRAAGATPLLGNLDDAASLRRLGGLADAVLHLAPPQGQGSTDKRTRHLLRQLARQLPQRVVYVSTTGVYGNAGGARFDETRHVAPATDRARRRVDAEQQLRRFGLRTGAQVSILRAPGIYAADRPGGDPRERVRAGKPVLVASEDVYTNHIHADDLARACLRALFAGWSQRIWHVCDDSELLMGDYFDRVADRAGLPRPRRVTRQEAARELTPVSLSFWSESRRLDNRRIKRELRLRLRYPGL